MPTFSAGDPGYKHRNESFATKVKRFFPSKVLSTLLYEPMGAEAEYFRQKNLGTIVECVDNSYVGSGAPSLTTVPNGGVVGNFYYRTDTPGTAGQRIYVCTVSGTSTAIGTWVEITSGLNYAAPASGGSYSVALSTVPTAVAGANAGATPPAPTVVANSTDTKGGVTFGTGTAPAAGNEVQINFGAAYAVIPSVVITAANAATAALQPYLASTATGNFVVGFGVAPAASQANTVYAVNFRVN